ncbi:hypothetical protein G8O24_11170 [Bradyrhizobium sp. INPA01-394B]|uniref:MACPF domain-containing protein n=1 Tax=Bradyrhizobium campsiandrae TaxID=1729892 RepID=A0ABR7U2I5_9BRAD|nr:MAC/perforin domain-containing protein [Bradyrhizobium campsiandrae]MBC9877901.1 hypothetical protein [Bradyrhizobium campsiandrae]MBC9978245.1 hypothetical protein [Bradyrhizobium campsiandrae]
MADKPVKPAIIMPKGLEATVIFGFNAKQWSFMPRRIFRPTYAEQDPSGTGRGWIYLKDVHISLEDTAFSVPDGMEARPDPRFGLTKTLVFHGTHALDEHEFKMSVKSSVSIEGFNSSVSTSLATKSSVTTNTKQSTALIAEWKAFYAVDVVDPPHLEVDFAAALKALPASHSADNQPVFEAFFAKWGTHYLSHGVYGGTYRMSTVLSEQDTLKIDETKLKVAVEAGFKAGKDGASVKSEFENNTRKELGTTDESTDITITAIGGDTDENPNTWALSIPGAPILMYDALAVATDELRPVFEPLWSLCDQIPIAQGEVDNRSAIGEALKQATLAYLPNEAADLPSVFGDVEVAAANRTFQADTNGFCLLSIADTTPSSATLSIEARADQSAQSPLLVEAKAQTLARNDYDAWIASASLFVPVRRGNWVSQSGDTNDVKTQYSGFMPANLAFGAWKPSPPAFQASSDGFLSVVVRATAREYGRSIQVGSQLVAKCIMASSHSGLGSAYDNNPVIGYMCAPIPKGSNVAVVGPPDMEGSTSCFWLDVDDPVVAFGPIQQLPALTGSAQGLRHDFPRDEQDRFVFGSIAVNNDGGRGTLSLAVVPERGGPPRPYATAACHLWHDGPRATPVTSAIAAVPRGHPWFANVVESSPGVSAQLFSLPLIPRKS